MKFNISREIVNPYAANIFNLENTDCLLIMFAAHIKNFDIKVQY